MPIKFSKASPLLASQQWDGFKLHIIVNDKGEILDFMITQAKVDDRIPLKSENFLKKIIGSVYGDKGYLSKELVALLFDQGLHLITGIRNNMKNVLMTMRDKILLRKRSVIEMTIQSIQNKSFSLLPVGENLFRKRDRVRASHVLYQNNNTQVISNGLVTYEKTSLVYLSLMWFSMTLGLLGILIVIIRGFYLLFRKDLFMSNQIITISFVSVVSLLLPIPFLLNQSFLNLGDMTIGNVLLAIVTGILPLALIFGLAKIWRNKPLKIDVIGILLILQWIIILIYWNVVPFRLWS